MSKKLFLFVGIRSLFFVVTWLLFSSSILAATVVENIDIDADGLANDIEDKLGTEPYLMDTDGDGINDKDEIGDVMKPRDSDQDGRLDALDLDDDNDGIPSVIEGTEDIDNDKIPNYLDDDSDGDDLPDSDEVRLSYRDTDNDYIDDLFDVDMTNSVDKNGDGVIDNFVLIDSDNDGIADIWDDDGQTNVVSKQSLAVEKRLTNLKTNSSTLGKKDEKGVTTVSLKKDATDNKPESYGGAGFFYCANNGKIVAGIARFMITPSHRVALIKDAREGSYLWRTEKVGIYVLQFKLPVGARLVQGLGKGRMILKQDDQSPTILGRGESTVKKGYLDGVVDNSQYWYTSFEIKKGAPLFLNNNIPLQGEICNK